MNYLSKKLKYKFKYELINNFKGGSKIDTMKDLFNLHFGQNWILTGSNAIQIYLDHFNITDFKFPVNDVDIFYINNKLLYITETRIGDYIAHQKTLEKSKTFSNDDTSFDVTILSSSHSYYEIDGIKLDVPQNMLELYNENIDRGRPYDQIKINALERIITRINPDDKKKIELPRKRARHYYDKDEENKEDDAVNDAAGAPPERLRFTHIPVDAQPDKSPKPLGASGALNFDDLAGSPPRPGAKASGALNFNDLTGSPPRSGAKASGALNFDDL